MVNVIPLGEDTPVDVQSKNEAHETEDGQAEDQTGGGPYYPMPLMHGEGTDGFIIIPELQTNLLERRHSCLILLLFDCCEGLGDNSHLVGKTLLVCLDVGSRKMV